MNILRDAMTMGDCKPVALCDVSQDTLELAAEEVNDMSGDQVKTYTDFRELLDKEKIDVAIVATPVFNDRLDTVVSRSTFADEPPVIVNTFAVTLFDVVLLSVTAPPTSNVRLFPEPTSSRFAAKPSDSVTNAAPEPDNVSSPTDRFSASAIDTPTVVAPVKSNSDAVTSTAVSVFSVPTVVSSVPATVAVPIEPPFNVKLVAVTFTVPVVVSPD